MSGALLLAGRGDCPRRLVQIARIYRQLGLQIDLAVKTREAKTGLEDITPRRLASFRDHQSLARLVPLLAAETPPDILHLAPGLAGESFDLPILPALVIADLEEVADQPAPMADLVLTPLETLRASVTANGQHALRLPLRFEGVERPLRLTKPRLFGWWGRWDERLAAAWRTLVEALRAADIMPAGALLLAGPGAETVHLPNCPVPVIRRPRAAPSCLRALDAAVLPDIPASTDRLREIQAGLVRRTPILGLDAWTSRFEDRWHLPAARDVPHLAELIGQHLPVWEPDRAAGALAWPLAQTVAAFRRDQAAMEAYVAREIAERLGLN